MRFYTHLILLILVSAATALGEAPFEERRGEEDRVKRGCEPGTYPICETDYQDTPLCCPNGQNSTGACDPTYRKQNCAQPQGHCCASLHDVTLSDRPCEAGTTETTLSLCASVCCCEGRFTEHENCFTTLAGSCRSVVAGEPRTTRFEHPCPSRLNPVYPSDFGIY